MPEHLTRGFVATDREAKCPFDPSPQLAEMARREGPTPVKVVEQEYGEVDVLTFHRHADVHAVYNDPRLDHSFIPAPEGAMHAALPGFFPRFHGAEHARLRRMVAGSFTPKRVEQLRPRIESIISGLLDEVEEAGPGVDLLQAYALPLPSIVIGEILGIPGAEHREFDRMCAGIVDLSLPPAEAFENFTRLNDYVGGLVAQNHRNPTDGLIGALVEQRHGEVSDEEIVGMVGALVLAGHETSASMISLSTLALIQQPDQLAVLLDDAHSGADAAEELLRYLSVAGGFPRMAKEDVTIGEYTVKAGEWVLPSPLNANRDPEVVSGDPNVLDLTREPIQIMTFGSGIHQCPGQHLARAELQTALVPLFRRFPGLRLAVPAEELSFHRYGPNVYALDALPVAW
ncbi:cytochrome P450 [Streptomyces fuscichromogenes]|uniref:cytochrome P450 n=1 Tax=Streptomyces fuscichromogenes TaxID=1324013 RepID=UPI00382A1849